MDGYSMTPLWGPRPQNDTISQLPSSDENRVDDDVVSLIYLLITFTYN